MVYDSDPVGWLRPTNLSLTDEQEFLVSLCQQPLCLTFCLALCFWIIIEIWLHGQAELGRIFELAVGFPLGWHLIDVHLFVITSQLWVTTVTEDSTLIWIVEGYIFDGAPLLRVMLSKDQSLILVHSLLWRSLLPLLFFFLLPLGLYNGLGTLHSTHCWSWSSLCLFLLVSISLYNQIQIKNDLF